MDEAEDAVAYDSAGANDAIVMGNATWHAEGGQVNGALHFNGIDTYIDTPFVLNPADTVFSVFAWVKNGIPGQVILSQENGINWLLADTEEGHLRTDIPDPIKQSRRGTTGGLPLVCDNVITDSNWHRVGFVWDGSDRILYVDDVEVARDTVDNLEQAKDSLNIGVGADLHPGTLWSGLIDDVRIYNRVVKP